jgi:hypothetical protein
MASRASAATTTSTVNSSIHMSTELNSVQRRCVTLRPIALAAAANGSPAFWSSSESSGRLPEANRATSSHAGKAMAGSSQAKSVRSGSSRCRISDPNRTTAIAATATITVSLVSAPQASSTPASTGRPRRAASSPASRKAQATGSAVSRDTLVSRPKYMAGSSPHSAW